MKTMDETLAAYLQAWNAHDLEGVVAFYHPDYEGTDVGQAKPIHGRDGARRTIAAILTAFPDMQLSAANPLLDGGRLAVEWRLTGTHLGPVMNIPPTRRQVEVRGISILTIRDGAIVYASHVWDVAGLLRSLGLLPDL
jgi:steroid delta-isomerase-like uncharacterized protein